MKKLPHIPAAYLMSTLSGLLLAASWPANGFPGLLFVAFLPMFFAEKFIRESGHNRLSTSFLVFWWGFFVFNFLTTYWVYYASGPGAIVAWVCNSMFMALVWYAFAWLMKYSSERIAVWGLLATWIAFEFGHMRWDLTWPWLTIGNAFANFPDWVQWYEYSGVLGGSLWVLTVNYAFMYALKSFTNQPLFRKKAALALGLIIVPVSFSYLRYFTYTESDYTASIVVVQPNIDPYNEKFSTDQQTQLEKLVALGMQKTDAQTDYIICPETAIPYGIWKHKQNNSEDLDYIRNSMLGFPNLKFITGLTYLEKFKGNEPDLPPQATQNRMGDWVVDYNSAMQIDSGSNLQIYHKSKLVPGPEMIPFQKFLKPFQESIFSNLGPIGNMGTQKERSVFYSTDSMKTAAPVICYESVFGDYMTDYVKKGATFIAIVTNDGWWKDTPGYKQHFAYARLRAVENRRAIARSANTGISGFINEKGDVMMQSKWDEAIALKADLPLNNKLSFYSKHGDIIGRMAFFGSIVLLLFQFMKRFLKKRNPYI